MKITLAQYQGAILNLDLVPENEAEKHQLGWLELRSKTAEAAFGTLSTVDDGKLGLSFQMKSHAQEAPMTKLRAHVERMIAANTDEESSAYASDPKNAVRRELQSLLEIIDQL